MQALWMLLACVMFALMGAGIKMASDLGADLPQIIVFRGAPSIILLLAWAALTRQSIRPVSWKLHIWRNVSGIMAMWMSFFALSSLPLATAFSLNYTSPLFIAGWMMFAGRQRDSVRTLAVVLGFVGVLAILRPSIGHDQFFAALVGLLAGALTAVAVMQIRQLGRAGEVEWRIVLIFSLVVCTSGLLGIGLTGWSKPSTGALLALVGQGCAGLVAQLAMTRAFGKGSTLLTAALQYSTIIFATLLGMILWGDTPDALVWTGILLIVGSGLLSTWRTFEQGRKNRQLAQGPVLANHVPDTEATKPATGKPLS